MERGKWAGWLLSAWGLSPSLTSGKGRGLGGVLDHSPLQPGSSSEGFGEFWRALQRPIRGNREGRTGAHVVAGGEGRGECVWPEQGIANTMA